MNQKRESKPELISTTGSLFSSCYCIIERFLLSQTWIPFFYWYWLLCKKTTLFCTHTCFPPWREEQTEDWLLGTCCSSAEMWTVLSWTNSWDSSASCFFCLASASWNMRTPHQILQAQPIMIQAKPNWSIPVMKTAQSHPWYSTSVQLAITVPNPTHHPFSAIGTWNNTVHNKIRNGRGASNLRDSEEVTISVRFLCNFGWHKKYYAFCGSNPWGYG